MKMLKIVRIDLPKESIVATEQRFFMKILFLLQYLSPTFQVSSLTLSFQDLSSKLFDWFRPDTPSNAFQH